MMLITDTDYRFNPAFLALLRRRIQSHSGLSLYARNTLRARRHGQAWPLDNAPIFWWGYYNWFPVKDFDLPPEDDADLNPRWLPPEDDADLNL
jgi:hypothetical protein